MYGKNIIVNILNCSLKIRNHFVLFKNKNVEQLVQPDIAIVMKIAVASLSNFHANIRNAG